MNPYEQAGEALLKETGCTVRNWRSSNSGRAYPQADDWGISCPRPRGPISFGVFAHEIGHQMLHRHNSLPRWRQEVEAEEYALAQFDRFGLRGRDRYENHAVNHLTHTFAKAASRSERVTVDIIAAFPEWWARTEQADLYALAHPSLSKARRKLDL